MTDASLHDPLVELPSMAAWAKWASLAPTMKSSTGRYGEGHKSCFEQPLPLLLFISPLNGWMGPNLPTNLWPGMFGMIIREQESIWWPSPPRQSPFPPHPHLIWLKWWGCLFPIHFLPGWGWGASGPCLSLSSHDIGSVSDALPSVIHCQVCILLSCLGMLWHQIYLVKGGKNAYQLFFVVVFTTGTLKIF